MGEMLIHPAAVAEADVADDDPRRTRMRLAIRSHHGEDRPDRALVAVQPAGQVGARVGDGVPGHPVGSLDRELRAADQPAGVLKTDRRGVVPLDAYGWCRASTCRLRRLFLDKPEVEAQL